MEICLCNSKRVANQKLSAAATGNLDCIQHHSKITTKDVVTQDLPQVFHEARMEMP